MGNLRNHITGELTGREGHKLGEDKGRKGNHGKWREEEKGEGEIGREDNIHTFNFLILQQK